jgi:hypothetical protein
VRSDRDRLRPLAREATLQLERVEQVRQLALSIGAPGSVSTLGLQVVEVDPANPMSRTADGHDARARRREQAIQQQSAESKVSEMVGPELHLETVGRPPLGDRHHAGIEYEQV